MSDNPPTTPAKIQAAILDPEDGEAGIVEVMSGRVLARFASLRSAAQTLRYHRADYERMLSNAR